MHKMKSIIILQTVLVVLIVGMIYLIYFNRDQVTTERFAPVEPGTETTLAINTNEHKDQFIISTPTYALYQPHISGRHLNFFSHAPNTVPFYPDNVWTAQISDPYYQPAYSKYFYQEGYFYPME